MWRCSKFERRQGRPGEVLQADKTGLVTLPVASDALRIEQLQLEWGRKMTAAEFLAGHDLRPGASMT